MGFNEERDMGASTTGTEIASSNPTPAPRYRIRSKSTFGGTPTVAVPPVPAAVMPNVDDAPSFMRDRRRTAVSVAGIPRTDRKASIAAGTKASSCNNCPYCEQKKGGVGMHRYQCKQAPWDVLGTRRIHGLQQKYPTPTHQKELKCWCKYCTVGFAGLRYLSMHVNQSRARTERSGLPVPSL